MTLSGLRSARRTEIASGTERKVDHVGNVQRCAAQHAVQRAQPDHDRAAVFGDTQFRVNALRQHLAALIVFLLAAMTDWVDGYWARRFGQVTKWGRIWDPFVDK